MADLQTLARPYAQAAFRVAQAESLETWSEALAKLGQAVADNGVQAAISSPQVSKAEAAELLCALAGAPGESLANFVRLLAEYRRLPLLPQVAEQFAALRAAAEKRLDAMVVTAMPVDAAQSSALQAALVRKLGREVSLEFSEDAELIGGAIVKTGDLVIDASVRGELERLAVQLH